MAAAVGTRRGGDIRQELKRRRALTAALGINDAEDMGATVERPAVQLAALLTAGVAVDRTAALDLLLALTGRRPLPPSITVV